MNLIRKISHGDANSTPISGRSLRRGVQIVGYDTGSPGNAESDGRAPALVIGEDGATRRERLGPGTRLSYALGDRHCAGVTDGDVHFGCAAERAPYCDVHASTWVCARCTGTCLKDEMDCHEEHAVYIAAFAPDTFKVGVTRSWRLETRLREQGADRAAHVHTVSNGRIARELEAEIAEELVDRVRVPTKISGLHASVDAERWTALLDEFPVIETFSFEYGLDLDRRPITETMATGTVVGTKGRVLVLERAGTTYAVDMRSLVGYDVREEVSDRDVQASLGAF